MPDLEQQFLEDLQGRQRRQEDAPLPRHLEEPTVEVETVTPERAAPRASASVDHGVTTANLLRHPDTHPVVLDFVLLKKYGPEWMVWEPETLEHFINRDFRGGVSDLNASKIQAAKTLHLVDTFWRQWEIFIPCLMAFNGVFPDFTVLRPPTVAQCAVAVDVANKIRDDVEWSLEVKQFISVIFQHDGIFCPVEPLDFVTVDVEGLPLNREEIMGLWPGVRASREPPKGDSITSEQLRRMLTVYNYLEEHRGRLKKQLPSADHA